ncbi:MAG: DinB family protein [Acidobacteriaceae bacterium]
MTMKRIAAGVVLTISSVVAAQAQMGGMGGAPAAASGTAVDPAKSFDASVSQIERTWMGAAQAMPADKYNFAPSAAIFVPGQTVKYDGVRTFAQIITHTIQTNYSLFASIGGIKPDVDTAAIAKLTSKDDIVKALADTFAFAHKAVANVTAANAFLSVRGTQTPVSMLAMAIGHANDEYGQAVEYLRMNGIVPPASAGGRRGM